jgi:uncharacterized coiled-coil protein SlyX
MEVDNDHSLKEHFSTIIDEVRARYTTRETTFTKMIVELESENHRLVHELNAAEETIDTLNVCLTERDAHISRLDQELDALRTKSRQNEVGGQLCTKASAPTIDSSQFDFLVSYSATVLDAESNRMDSICAALSHMTDLSRGNTLVAQESDRRCSLSAMEAHAVEAICSTMLDIESCILRERAKRCAVSRYAMEACLAWGAAWCLTGKQQSVEQEDRAWNLLKRDFLSFPSADEASISVDGPNEHKHLFWSCCLDEAQLVLRSISTVSDDDQVLCDVCASIDLPELMHSVAQLANQTEAMHIWLSTVVVPLQKVCEGESSLSQLSNHIIDALEHVHR